MRVIVETSARHIHIAQEHLDILFGKGHILTRKKNLSQPGQYACDEKLTVVGAKRELVMSILAPVRAETQVELSATDARTIGVNPVVRESGDIDGTPGCKLVGPCGEVLLSKGVIVAKRHLHVTPSDALALNVSDKEIVSVKLDYGCRKTIFGDVVVRVSPSFATAVHIDTDESNASSCPMDAFGEIVK